MITFPNAKINIGLQITDKRPDGFHNIASCFYSINWVDVLEVVSADKLSFGSSGIVIPGDAATNLCLRAYEALKADFDLPPVAIHLLKIIPIGAGLGGGSADAAFMLKLLNSFFELNITPTQLENYARRLGSDCAFFIQNKPQFCFNKGDDFEDIAIDLSHKKIVLVYPNLHISTAEAYANVQPQRPKIDLREALKSPIKDWKEHVTNDFEKGLFQKYAILPQVKQKMYDLGADYASMTGSGSTIYGIFDAECSDLKQEFGDFLVWESKISTFAT
jgi:4-diphosphocytidyl-2-C-methyl-D-erythritol kinase